ncbi:TetR/AcrR family transcriptional regulator [Anaerosalibacter bizertensis]|uniref:TetR/AcrR family transcriptional regulator n=1 Tax=Anaerosalibacter bizertensis TaxID=932217 RepID=UPI001C0ECC95|nr:TetR/AcrR family transcriptional regulator [Anaerosalibacter bizertensis]
MDNHTKNYKEIILSEAKDIAINQGISKVNIRSVAKNSGIATGTVYNYFPSKAALLIVIIEDFWQGAFAEIDWQGLEDNDFYENLEQIYNILHSYLNKFKENWIEQLYLLKRDEKLLGKQKEIEYFGKIQNMIIRLMNMDDKLRNYQWTDTISKEKTAEFIFENMLNMLKKEEQDIEFFIEVLKKMFN